MTLSHCLGRIPVAAPFHQVEVVAASKAWTASPMPELYSYQPVHFHLEDVAGATRSYPSYVMVG